MEIKWYKPLTEKKWFKAIIATIIILISGLFLTSIILINNKFSTYVRLPMSHNEVDNVVILDDEGEAFFYEDYDLKTKFIIPIINEEVTTKGDASISAFVTEDHDVYHFEFALSAKKLKFTSPILNGSIGTLFIDFNSTFTYNDVDGATPISNETIFNIHNFEWDGVDDYLSIDNLLYQDINSTQPITNEQIEGESNYRRELLTFNNYHTSEYTISKTYIDKVLISDSYDKDMYLAFTSEIF